MRRTYNFINLSIHSLQAALLIVYIMKGLAGLYKTVLDIKIASKTFEKINLPEKSLRPLREIEDGFIDSELDKLAEAVLTEGKYNSDKIIVRMFCARSYMGNINFLNKYSFIEY